MLLISPKGMLRDKSSGFQGYFSTGKVFNLLIEIRQSWIIECFYFYSYF